MLTAQKLLLSTFFVIAIAIIIDGAFAWPPERLSPKSFCKPGVCPHEDVSVALRGKDIKVDGDSDKTATCENDHSCPGKKKCCSIEGKRKCVDPVEKKEKPGTCPKAPKGIITTCLATCSGDWDCPSKQKCCSWGCGRKCMKVKGGDDKDDSKSKEGHDDSDESGSKEKGDKKDKGDGKKDKGDDKKDKGHDKKHKGHDKKKGGEDANSDSSEKKNKNNSKDENKSN